MECPHCNPRDNLTVQETKGLLAWYGRMGVIKKGGGGGGGGGVGGSPERERERVDAP